MAADSFLGGVAAGLAPAFQAQMYAKALRNAGIGKEGSGVSATVPPSASWWQRNMPSWLGGAEPSGTASGGDPMMSVLPGTASWAAAAGNRPLTTSAPTPLYNPLVATATAPASTGTTQGHPAARRPMFVPPMPPSGAMPPPANWPPSPIAPQGLPPRPLPQRAPMPPMPTALNASDVGSGNLLFAPGTAGGFGAFGDITSAPGAAGNFQNQFGWGLPWTNQSYRKWFTERYGTPPGQTAGM